MYHPYIVRYIGVGGLTAEQEDTLHRRYAETAMSYIVSKSRAEDMLVLLIALALIHSKHLQSEFTRY
jgi:hypothetical protein